MNDNSKMIMCIKYSYFTFYEYHQTIWIWKTEVTLHKTTTKRNMRRVIYSAKCKEH